MATAKLTEKIMAAAGQESVNEWLRFGVGWVLGHAAKGDRGIQESLARLLTSCGWTCRPPAVRRQKAAA